MARVAGRYRKVLDSKRPSVFECECASGPNRKTLCRRLLLPFTAEGKSIDYIVGALTSRVVEADAPDAGLKSQSRAPFIPVVKLAFGSGYEKTRLSEYAAALSYAKRCGRTQVDFKSCLESQQGGLKGCVRAERAARRTARRAAGTVPKDTTENEKERLRTVESLGLITDLEGGEEGFVLILGRRSVGRPGIIEVLRILDERPSLVGAAAGRAARAIRRETQDRPGPRQKPRPAGQAASK